MTVSLEDKLYLEVPEGFHELSEEERSNLTFLEDGHIMCLSDPARHILITASWKRINGFSAMMLKTSDIAGKMTQQIRTGMQAFQYDQLSTVSRTVAGRKAEGILFEYEAEGISMSGESLALKCGKDLFYFNCYARRTSDSERFAVFEKMLDAAII